MDFKILCVMTALNILMLLASGFINSDTAEMLEEIREKADCRGLRSRNDGERGGFDEDD